MNPNSAAAWLDGIVPPHTGLASPMRWSPPDEDTDVELPAWSWLVGAAPGNEAPQ